MYSKSVGMIFLGLLALVRSSNLDRVGWPFLVLAILGLACSCAGFICLMLWTQQGGVEKNK